jgi:cell division protein FtsW
MRYPQSKPRVMGVKRHDPWLLIPSLLLLALGLIMVLSTSINIAEKQFNDPLALFWRQTTFAALGLLWGLVFYQIPIMFWQRINGYLIILTGLLLLLVLIPPLGHEVNGSMRWFRLSGFSLQPSEAMKLAMIMYLAGYLIRRQDEIRLALKGFFKAMLVLIVISSLILLEPDYGATVVLFSTALGMLFIAGVPMRHFLLWFGSVSLALALIGVFASYRIQRLTTFLDPWADPFDKGFQLVQALIAIGRGHWFGVGLGASVQKFTYLPEAHTDFLFAILAEELGFIGSVSVLILFSLLIFRSFYIAQQAMQAKLYYAAYLAYGISLSLGLQVGINLGVNMGLLPTKGLTLPLMSYGGSNLLIIFIMLAILSRVHYETPITSSKPKKCDSQANV